LPAVCGREQPFGAPGVDAERPDGIYLGLWLNPERTAMRTLFCAAAGERTRMELVVEQVGRWRQMTNPAAGD
jgi:hypothetical protein